MFPCMCATVVADFLNLATGGISGPRAIVAISIALMLLAMFHFLKKFPTDRLLPDFVVMIGVGIHVYFLLESVGSPGLDGWMGYVACMPATLFVLGWHSSCICFFQVYLLAYIYARRMSDVSLYNRYVCPIYSLLCIGGVLLCEYWLARLVQELGEQSRATQRLLDRATDGFGTIDASSGMVLSASPSLANNLLCEFSGNALVGRHLQEFVDTGDAMQLRCLQGLEDARMLDSAPMLLTFNQKAAPTLLKSLASFDATLIAYGASDTRIQICIKRLGELRPVKTQKSRYQTPSCPQMFKSTEDLDFELSDATSISSPMSDLGLEATNGCCGGVHRIHKASSTKTASDISFTWSITHTLTYSMDSMSEAGTNSSATKPYSETVISL